MSASAEKLFGRYIVQAELLWQGLHIGGQVRATPPHPVDFPETIIHTADCRHWI